MLSDIGQSVTLDNHFQLNLHFSPFTLLTENLLSFNEQFGFGTQLLRRPT